MSVAKTCQATNPEYGCPCTREHGHEGIHVSRCGFHHDWMDAPPAPKRFIQTYSGRTVEPYDPDPAAICVLDIAHHLSMLCRFTGAVRQFYSIAQHSVLVSALCDPEDALAGLLHDAEEYVFAD